MIVDATITYLKLYCLCIITDCNYSYFNAIVKKVLCVGLFDILIDRPSTWKEIIRLNECNEKSQNSLNLDTVRRHIWVQSLTMQNYIF